MTKKVMKEIRKLYCEECETGHLICDFDDREHDLEEIADVIEIEMNYNEDTEEYEFATVEDEQLANEALDYYYSLHNC